MIQVKERSIHGKTVKVQQLPARKAILLKAKLVRIFGPSLGKLADGFKGGSFLDADLDISGAAEKLFAALPEDKVLPLIDELLKGVFVDNLDVSSEDKFDHVFTEDQMLLYKTIGFVLEVNYKSFLEKSGIGSHFKQSQTVPQSDSVPESTKN